MTVFMDPEMRHRPFRHLYIVGVWLLAIPAVLLCGFAGLLLMPIVPFFMAAPLLGALVLTFPLIEDRPHYRPLFVIGLFLGQVAAAYAAILLLAGTPAAWRRNTGEAAWLIGTILPFAIIAVVLLGARRDDRHTPLTTPAPHVHGEL
ncbi:MAG: hypothetical protein IPP90_11385 [Gemmatimonadaceae bacterium]|nr:hypothetical protein [Gemmatimonadaceae bacterium]